jgi:parallel beta-helix repeat protein
MGNVEGVVVQTATNNTILDNIIADNDGRGVLVGNGATNTTILGNSIFANGGLGIDLAGGTVDPNTGQNSEDPNTGVTHNDPGDGDTGANNLQNFPELTSVSSVAGSTTITGTLNSLPSLPLLPTSFRIEFFASDAADPSGHGEGQTFLGSTDVTTDSNGDVSFTATLSATVGASQAVTATATRLDDGTPRETSEFSQVFVAAVPAVPSLSISSVSVTEGNAGTVNAVFTVTLSEASSQTVTVNFTTVDGTALTADNDYQPASGTLTFDPGQTTKTITVLVNGDTIIENDETFTVNLSNPQNATIASGAGTGAIQNDDAPPPAPPPPIARAQRLTFKLVSRSAAFRNELGLFQVDSADGRIGNLRPGDPGYAAAALARRRVLFRRDDGAGTIRRITLPAGAFFGLYLVQNGSSAEVVARNHNHSSHRRPQVFFSFTAANSDRFAHIRWLSARQFAFEDLTGGGDRDFNDLVARFSVAAR